MATASAVRTIGNLYLLKRVKHIRIRWILERFSLTLREHVLTAHSKTVFRTIATCSFWSTPTFPKNNCQKIQHCRTWSVSTRKFQNTQGLSCSLVRLQELQVVSSSCTQGQTSIRNRFAQPKKKSGYLQQHSITSSINGIYRY